VIRFDAGVKCGAAISDNGCTYSTVITGLTKVDFILALAGLAASSMEERMTGQTSKNSLTRFIIHILDTAVDTA
jgi:hypothetical protein